MILNHITKIQQRRSDDDDDDDDDDDEEEEEEKEEEVHEVGNEQLKDISESLDSSTMRKRSTRKLNRLTFLLLPCV
jgi:hypothetical protein